VRKLPHAEERQELLHRSGILDTPHNTFQLSCPALKRRVPAEGYPRCPFRNLPNLITGYRGSYFAPDGKRRNVSAKTKREAERVLRDAMTDADRGLVFDASNQTVADYMTRWSGVNTILAST
jgi:hypothetical protein